MKYSLIFQTDQEICFNSTGRIVSCEGTGQDGESKTGIPWPFPRFLETGPLITDRLTGLKWSKDASVSEFPMTWKEAGDFMIEMNRSRMHGCGRWRLPNRRELFSLISHRNINPALPDNHLFTNVFNGYYWTRTPCSRLPDQAWYVHLGGGRVFKGMKHGSYMVWPVCSPEQEDNDIHLRFKREDSSVLDTVTGLVWHMQADPTNGPVSWESALSAVKKLNESTKHIHLNWRLPNIRELESLMDVGFHSPALPPDHSFKDVREGYWSSTSSVYDPAYAWVLYPRDGAVGVGYKIKPEFYVWAVADGPGID